MIVRVALLVVRKLTLTDAQAVPGTTCVIHRSRHRPTIETGARDLSHVPPPYLASVDMTTRRTAIGLSTCILAAALTGCGANDTSEPGGGGSSSPRPSASPPTTAIQHELDKMVSEGVTGVGATISIDGDVTQLVAGVGNRKTGAPYPRDARVRIASVTKPFTSALVMLLVGSGEVDLDAPIERYLPGLLHGPGIDPEAITVRQILQHRSGLPEYAKEPEVTRPRSTNHPRTFSPRDLIKLALRHPAQFPPGTKMVYTATNFVVAGMLVEKVTGTTFSVALRERITEPLGLEETYLPDPGDRSLPRPHPHGYETVGDRTTDVTGLEPSGPWAAGGIVSTGADLDKFLTALVQGDIIAPAELREMQRTVSEWDYQVSATGWDSCGSD